MNSKELQERLRAAEEEIAQLRAEMQKQPPKWEDLGKVGGWYIRSSSDIDFYKGTCNKYNKNISPTREGAESKLAEAQLEQLRDSKFYRNGWKPDWNDEDQDRYSIVADADGFCVFKSQKSIEKFTFQDYEIARVFLEDQRELLEIWKKGQMQ